MMQRFIETVLSSIFGASTLEELRPVPVRATSVLPRRLGRPRKLGVDVDRLAVLGREVPVVSLELGALAGVVRVPVDAGR